MLDECRLKRVMTKDDSKLIIDLFRMIGKKGPEQGLLAVADETTCRQDCEHRHTWGTSTYCNNQHKIKDSVTKESKTPPQATGRDKMPSIL